MSTKVEKLVILTEVVSGYSGNFKTYPDKDESFFIKLDPSMDNRREIKENKLYRLTVFTSSSSPIEPFLQEKRGRVVLREYEVPPDLAFIETPRYRLIGEERELRFGDRHKAEKILPEDDYSNAIEKFKEIINESPVSLRNDFNFKWKFSEENLVIVPIDLELEPDSISDPRNYTRIGYTSLLIPPTSISVRSDINTESVDILRDKGQVKELGFNNVKQIDISFVAPDLEHFNKIVIPLLRQYNRTPFLPIDNSYLNLGLNIDAIAIKEFYIESLGDIPGAVTVRIIAEPFAWWHYLPGEESFGGTWCWPLFKAWCEDYTIRSHRFPQKPREPLNGRIKIKIPKGDTVEKIIRPQTRIESTLFAGNYSPTGIIQPVSIGASEDYELAFFALLAASSKDNQTIDLEYNEATVVWLEGAPYILTKFRFSENIIDALLDGSISAYTSWDTVGLDKSEINKKFKGKKSLIFFPKDGIPMSERKIAAKNLETGPKEVGEFGSPYFLIPKNSPIWRKVLSRGKVLNSNQIIEMDMEEYELSEKSSISHIGIQISSRIASIIVKNENIPVHQMTGGESVYVTLQGTLVGEEEVAKLNDIFERVKTLAKNYRAKPWDIPYLGFLEIENPLINSSGVSAFLPLSFSVSTVEGVPGIYSFQIDLLEYNKTQSRKEDFEAMEAVIDKWILTPVSEGQNTPIGRDEFSSVYNSNYSDQVLKLMVRIFETYKTKIWRSNLYKIALKMLELYPDMSLPTKPKLDYWIKLLKNFYFTGKYEQTPYNEYILGVMLNGIELDVRNIDRIPLLRESGDPIGFVEPDFYCVPSESYKDWVNIFLDSHLPKTEDSKSEFDSLGNVLCKDRFGGKYLLAPGRVLGEEEPENSIISDEDIKFREYQKAELKKLADKYVSFPQPYGNRDYLYDIYKIPRPSSGDTEILSRPYNVAPINDQPSVTDQVFTEGNRILRIDGQKISSGSSITESIIKSRVVGSATVNNEISIMFNPPPAEPKPPKKDSKVVKKFGDGASRIYKEMLDWINDAIRLNKIEDKVDEALVVAIILRESGGRPDLVSSKGYVGLMQLKVEDDVFGDRYIRNRLKRLGLFNNYSTDDLKDPKTNIYIGVTRLASYLDRFSLTKSLLKHVGSPNFTSYVSDIYALAEWWREERPVSREPIINSLMSGVSRIPTDNTPIGMFNFNKSKGKVDPKIKNLTSSLRNKDHTMRLVGAFPSFLVLIIDEGRWVGVEKLWDKSYSGIGVSSIDISRSRKDPVDVATVVFSNVYGKLTSAAAYTKQQRMHDFRNEITIAAQIRKIYQFFWGYALEELTQRWQQYVRLMLLRPGARLHIRLGYGSDASKYQVKFNGAISEVSAGGVECSVVAVGDGAELVNKFPDSHRNMVFDDKIQGPKEHKMYQNTGKFNLHGKEPRNIIAELFQPQNEVLAAITKGRWFSDNVNGIVHFGTVDFSIGYPKYDIGEVGVNLNTSKDDPDNWTSQFTNWATINGSLAHLMGHTLLGIQVEDASPWKVIETCRKAVPDFIAAVRPFEFRSTLFYGKSWFPFYYQYKGDFDIVYKNMVEGIRKVTGKFIPEPEGSTVETIQYHDMMDSYSFCQLHIICSGYNLIQNNITATSEGLFTNCQSKYIYGGVFGTKIIDGDIMRADSDIYPEYQKTKIQMSGLLSGTLFGFEGLQTIPNTVLGGLTNHVNTAANTYSAMTIRDSLADMYQGTNLILGDPFINPWDYVYLLDSTNLMNGLYQVKEVVDHFSTEAGYMTAVSPDCMVSVASGTEPSLWLSLARIGYSFATYKILKYAAGHLIRWLSAEKIVKEVAEEAVKKTSQALAIGTSEEPALYSEPIKFWEIIKEWWRQVRTEGFKSAIPKPVQKVIRFFRNLGESIRYKIDLRDVFQQTRAGIGKAFLAIEQAIDMGPPTALVNYGKRFLVVYTRSSAAAKKPILPALPSTLFQLFTMILLGSIGDMIGRWLSSSQCVVIMPLKIGNLEFSAGIEGHMGAVIGDPMSFSDAFWAGLFSYELHNQRGSFPFFPFLLDFLLPGAGTGWNPGEFSDFKTEEIDWKKLANSYPGVQNNKTDYVEFNKYIERLDRMSSRPSVSLPEKSDSSSEISSFSLVEAAKEYEGIPYVWGGDLSNIERYGGLDCSGFVQAVYKKFGISLPRTAALQYNVCTIINKEDLVPGDLTFKIKNGRVTHVGIYRGDGMVMQAPRTGKNVTLTSPLESSTWNAYGRINLGLIKK